MSSQGRECEPRRVQRQEAHPISQAQEVGPCLPSSVPFGVEKGHPCLKQDIHRLRKQRTPRWQLRLLKNQEVTATPSSFTFKGHDYAQALPGPRGKVAPASLGWARPSSKARVTESHACRDRWVREMWKASWVRDKARR